MSAGPVAALLNSLQLVGWTLASHAILCDDRMRKFDLRLDPRIVVCHAVEASVRRWRLARVARTFHGMEDLSVRGEDGTGQPTHLLHSDVVDMSRSIRLTRAGRTSVCKSVPGWSNLHGSMLASAISGGQWPQARLFSAKKFDVQDDLCQLCRGAAGTIEHRYQCPATRPSSGWIQRNPDAEQFINALNPLHRLALTTRGIMMPKVVIPPPAAEACLHWHLPLPECIPELTTFYIDASAMDADCKPLARLGFAIVVVAPSGELVALAYGCPPNWIVDSAGAETWALYIVASFSPVLPYVVTDCLGVVNTLRDGKVRATSSFRPLARVWNMIFLRMAPAAPSASN